MNFTVGTGLVAEVVAHLLGQQVAAVAGGANQDVGRGSCHGAIQNGFQRLVAALAFFKAQVIAVDEEFFGPCGHHIHDVGQIHQIGFIYFNQAQALGSVAVQTGLDERRLARAARTREQHVVSAAPLHKLRHVALHFVFLCINFAQVFQARGGQLVHRLQAGTTAALAVAPGQRPAVPIRGLQGMGQHSLQACQQLLGTADQRSEIFSHFGTLALCSKREQLLFQELLATA